MPIHLGSVAHFSLAVTDPEKTAAWWLSLFDLEEYRRNEQRVVLGNDAVLLAFFRGTPDPATLGHLAFHTDGIEALRAARDMLRDRGVPMEDPGEEIGPVAPGSKSLGLWFHDLDGYRWELFVRDPE